jgi:hypothetical protein
MLGSVTNMFHGTTSEMDAFVIYELENKPITSYMGHYCLFSDVVATTVYVLWTQLTWKCKILMLNDNKMMALPFASCSSTELVQFN